MTGPALSTLAREVLLPAPEQDIIETSGEAGDVMLTHPLLLHARCELKSARYTKMGVSVIPFSSVER